MEDRYLKALVDINNESLSQEDWLKKYLELYQTTITQPEGLPAIRRSMMQKGSLRLKFHEVYHDLLKEYQNNR